MNVLCPELYRRLEERFGSVMVANAGDAFQARYTQHPFSDEKRVHVICPGEYYRVCCPKCKDTRHRLWINHRWVEFPWLIRCFNEKCYDSRLSRDQLLFFVMKTRRPKKPAVNPGRRKGPNEIGRVDPPGSVVPLDRLPADHAANIYLQQRGFDPVELSKNYGIAYCDDPDPRYEMAGNRLIIPIVIRGELVGWQARFIGDRDWKNCSVAKYYSAPGMAKRLILYNLDQAKQQPFIVLVEGVTDVWRVGPMAVAMLGKSMSFTQKRELICSFRLKPLVVMLDGDALSENDGVCQELASEFEKGIVKVSLPDGSDPASLPREEIMDLILRAAHDQGVDSSPFLSFLQGPGVG
jgi:hypothetical protein